MGTGLGWLTPSPPSVDAIDLPRSPDGRVDLMALVTAGATLLLESAPSTPGTGRWSYVVLQPSGRLTHDGDSCHLDGPTGALDLGPDPFAAIDLVAEALQSTPDGGRDLATGPTFLGGLAGAWSYDLARLVERLPARAAADRSAPWLDLRIVTDLMAIDHRDESAWRVQRPVRGGLPHPSNDEVVGAAVRAQGQPHVPTPPPAGLASSLSRDRYLAALDRVFEHIAAGDVFQVNLTQRLTCEWAGTPAELYARLRGASPAPHGALFVQGRHRALASISPETFLLATGRRVQTRPIKGTRPRHDDPAADAAARDDLVASAKDRAENVMVVDMERNDLGRVCVPGSVRATDLLEPEPHPTVWQLVSTVAGTLRPDVGWGGLLRATFPSGSVTGTPKVRAMQLIDGLEPVRRSWYCGSIGWIGPGSASLSVAIRTAVLADGVLDYGAGGGIVADSDPEAEIAESWVKAAAFLRAIGLPDWGEA